MAPGKGKSRAKPGFVHNKKESIRAVQRASD